MPGSARGVERRASRGARRIRAVPGEPPDAGRAVRAGPHAARAGPSVSAREEVAAGAGLAWSSLGDLRASRSSAVGRQGEVRDCQNRRPGPRPRRPDTDRAEPGRPGREGTDQPGGGSSPVREREHRRGEPSPDLQQARGPVSDRALTTTLRAIAPTRSGRNVGRPPLRAEANSRGPSPFNVPIPRFARLSLPPRLEAARTKGISIGRDEPVGTPQQPEDTRTVCQTVLYGPRLGAARFGPRGDGRIPPKGIGSRRRPLRSLRVPDLRARPGPAQEHGRRRGPRAGHLPQGLAPRYGIRSGARVARHLDPADRPEPRDRPPAPANSRNEVPRVRGGASRGFVRFGMIALRGASTLFASSTLFQ